jgi:DNA polymerase-3 subunit gamma/tau
LVTDPRYWQVFVVVSQVWPEPHSASVVHDANPVSDVQKPAVVSQKSGDVQSASVVQGVAETVPVTQSPVTTSQKSPDAQSASEVQAGAPEPEPEPVPVPVPVPEPLP